MVLAASQAGSCSPMSSQGRAHKSSAAITDQKKHQPCTRTQHNLQQNQRRSVNQHQLNTQPTPLKSTTTYTLTTRGPITEPEQRATNSYAQHQQHLAQKYTANHNNTTLQLGAVEPCVPTRITTHQPTTLGSVEHNDPGEHNAATWLSRTPQPNAANDTTGTTTRGTNES